jgi:hypothetical protein
MKPPSRLGTDATAMESSSSSLAPSDDVPAAATDVELIARAQELVTEERLLAAARLLKKVDDSSLLHDSHDAILKSAAAFEVAIEDLLGQPLASSTSSDTGDDSSSSDWKKQGESNDGHFNTAIYYKVDDEARLTCRIDTPIEASLLIPLLSVLNEVDLYETWIPSWNYPKMGIRRSQQLEERTRAHRTLIVTSNVPWPLATREVVMEAVAVDDIDETGWIAVRMETVETGGVVPPPDYGVERMDFAGAFLFRACPADHPTLQRQHSNASNNSTGMQHDDTPTPTTTDNTDTSQEQEQERLVLVSFKMFLDAHIANVPMSLINFVTRTVIGHIWAMLLQVAQDIREGRRPQHAQVIADKPDFYRWVETRVQVMLDQLQEESALDAKN